MDTCASTFSHGGGRGGAVIITPRSSGPSSISSTASSGLFKVGPRHMWLPPGGGASAILISGLPEEARIWVSPGHRFSIRDAVPLPQRSLSSRDSGGLPSPPHAADMAPQPLPDPPGGGTGPHYTYEAIHSPLLPISETERSLAEPGLALHGTSSLASIASAGSGKTPRFRGAKPPAAAAVSLGSGDYSDPFDGLHEGSPTKPVPGRPVASPPRRGTAETDSEHDSSRGSSPAAVSLSPPGLSRATAVAEEAQAAASDSDSPGSPPPIRRPAGHYADIMQRGRAPVQWPPEGSVEVFRVGEDELLPGHPELSADFPGDEAPRALLEPRHAAGDIVPADEGPAAAQVAMQAWRWHTLEDVPEDSGELGRAESYGVTGSPQAPTPTAGGHGPVAEANSGMATHRTKAYAYVHGLATAPVVRPLLQSNGRSMTAPPPRPRQRSQRPSRHKSPMRRFPFCMCSATNSGFEAFSDEFESPRVPPPALGVSPPRGPLTSAHMHPVHAQRPAAPQRASIDIASLSSSVRAEHPSMLRYRSQRAAPPAVPRLQLEPRSRVGQTPHAARPQSFPARHPAVRHSMGVILAHAHDGPLRRSPSDSNLPSASPARPLRQHGTSGGSSTDDLFGSPMHSPQEVMAHARGPAAGPVAEAAAQHGGMAAESPSLQSVRIGVAAVAVPRGAALARGRLDFELRRDIMDGKLARRGRPQLDYWRNKDLALMLCRAVLGRDVMDGCEYEAAAEEEYTQGGAYFTA
eukprot:jgi/Ulvmu1/7744/UM039_0052.1